MCLDESNCQVRKDNSGDISPRKSLFLTVVVILHMIFRTDSLETFADFQHSNQQRSTARTIAVKLHPLDVALASEQAIQTSDKPLAKAEAGISFPVIALNCAPTCKI